MTIDEHGMACPDEDEVEYPDWEAEYRAQCTINSGLRRKVNDLKSQLAEAQKRSRCIVCHADICEVHTTEWIVETQKDRDKLAGAMREIAVYGNKHMPAPEYAKEVLRMMEAENGRT